LREGSKKNKPFTTSSGVAAEIVKSKKGHNQACKLGLDLELAADNQVLEVIVYAEPVKPLVGG
jgi:hypothetical protein